MRYIDVEQNTPEWEQYKLGKIGASESFLLFSYKDTAGYQDMIYAKAHELVTGEKDIQYYTNYHMIRGLTLEPEAANYYAATEFKTVTIAGMVEYNDFYSVSPDRFVGAGMHTPYDKLTDNDGLLEIKCMKLKNHIALLEGGSFSRRYILQCMGQMFASGRKWCDLMSFYPGYEKHVDRVCMTDEVEADFQFKLMEAEWDIKEKVKQLNKYKL